MITMDALQGEKRRDVIHLAAVHGAKNIRVFGSVARGESSPTSDLDLLVDWEAGRTLLDHVALVQDLEELLGTKVHVGTERELQWYVRKRILAEARRL